MNLLEISKGIVHADGYGGDDHTLCGVTTEKTLESMEEYTAEVFARETETEPYLVKTKDKIDCETCAAIIRYCCKLGMKSIKKGGAE